MGLLCDAHSPSDALQAMLGEQVAATQTAPGRARGSTSPKTSESTADAVEAAVVVGVVSGAEAAKARLRAGVMAGASAAPAVSAGISLRPPCFPRPCYRRRMLLQLLARRAGVAVTILLPRLQLRRPQNLRGGEARATRRLPPQGAPRRDSGSVIRNRGRG